MYTLAPARNQHNRGHGCRIFGALARSVRGR
jgi:hypothetical protein